MSKTMKRSLMVILIAILVFAVLWLGYDMVRKEPASTNANTSLVDGNTGLDNILNQLFDEVNEVSQDENVVNDVTNTDNNQIDNTLANETKDEDETLTSKEQRAIELVRKEWGTSEGVYFSNESIDASGRYIISVRDKKTTSSLAFYLVDVDKQLVTEQ